MYTYPKNTEICTSKNYVLVEVSLKVNSLKMPLKGFSSSGFYNLY